MLSSPKVSKVLAFAIQQSLFSCSRTSSDWMPTREVKVSLGKWLAAAAAKSLQSCPTLCDPIDGSPLGSPIPGILQARTLEWVAISFSNAWKWKVKVKSLSHVRLLATSWTAAYQAPLSMGFSRQEYWSGVPLPSLFINLIFKQIGHSIIFHWVSKYLMSSYCAPLLVLC